MLMRFAILAFCLRALIPAGFMPGSAADGTLLQLCPDGMTQAEMQALFPNDHHHHGHEEGSGEIKGETFSCPLGLTVNELFISVEAEPPSSDDLNPSVLPRLVYASVRRLQSVYKPRAPPLHIQS